MAAEPLEVRMARLEGAYEQINKRLDAIEADIRELRSSLESLRRDLTAQMASQFRWVVGLWATTILAVLGLYLRR
jgi:chaperonin cofactor prefoldin